MKTPQLSLILVLSIVSCGQTNNNKTTDSTATAIVAPMDTTAYDMQEKDDEGGEEEERGKRIELDSTLYAHLKWADPMIDRYTKLSDKDEIKQAVKSKDSTLDWVWDQILDTDTATYIIFNVGHTMTDEDGSSPRYTNLQWVYLDTVTRQIYEYDLPKDKLISWNK